VRAVAAGVAGAAVALGCWSGCATSDAAAVRAGTAGAVEEGLGSYYAHRFAGRRTASGERYDPKAMTAAHRTIPFGTWVTVSRTDRRDRRVEVRINDRGPWAKRHVIDVSEAAARKLDMLRIGVAPVRIEVMSRRR